MQSDMRSWVEQELNDPEAEREIQQERLVLDVTEAICEEMESRGISRADLARNLDTSRSYVTQLLSGSRNLTLRTLSDIAWACGARVQVQFESSQQPRTLFEHRVVTMRTMVRSVPETRMSTRPQDTRESASRLTLLAS